MLPGSLWAKVRVKEDENGVAMVNVILIMSFVVMTIVVDVIIDTSRPVTATVAPAADSNACLAPT